MLSKKEKKLFLLNFRAGRHEMPDRESATFKTILGHLDERVKLDKTLIPGDRKYNRALSAMAAKLAYENKAFVETTVKKHWEQVNIYKKYMYQIYIYIIN